MSLLTTIARPVAALATLAFPALAQQADTGARRDTIELAPVVVTGSAPDHLNIRTTLTATKTPRLLRDVPQAINVLGSRLLLDQSAQSMLDVVRFFPGVSMGQGEGHRDAPTIRGTSSTADFFLDGVRDDAQYLRDLYNIERIEAIKGPNAMVFGRGGGGGVINRVSKGAQWSPTRALTFAGGSYAHKRSTADIGGALTSRAAARLNALYEHSDQFRDFTSVERLGLNPTVAFQVGPERTMVTLGYERFADRRTVNRGIPSFAGLPSHAPIAAFFGDPNASYSRTVVDGATATIERRSESGLSIRNRTRWTRYDKYYQNVYPGAVDATETMVTLSGYNNATDRHNLFNQTDLMLTVGRRGGVRQTFLLGGEIGRQTTTNFRNTGYFNDSLTSYQVPFASPTVQAPVTFRQSASDADNDTYALVASLYVQDEITIGDRWQAVLGARYDRFALEFTNHRNGQLLWRVDRKISPRAGLVFKPAEAVSFYTSYSVSFLPASGDQFSSLNATSQTLVPERFENSEIGVKWDVAQGLTVTGAAYHLDRTNTTAPDPNVAGQVVQTGSQRSTGFELSALGSITARWEIAAGLASQHARVVSRTQAAAPGQIVPLVPRVMLSLWNRYDVTPWLGAGLGLIHQDDMYAAIDNAVTLPGFTRLDVAAYLTLSRQLRAQINVENVLDTRYYVTSHGNNNIMPGAPRSLRVMMTATP